jgi:DNA-binding PadR family transcriptional regulator
MSIKFVILGYLSWQPMTGYDLKKIIAASETLPWSANNNQIYRALVQLHHDRWVTKTIEQQDGSPNRHVYAVTETGLQALREWVTSAPEPPYTKNPFLHQLMWADCLPPEKLDDLLEAYLNEVGTKLFFIRVQADRRPDVPQRTPREQRLWDSIYQNWTAHYELELKWVRHLRQELQDMETERQRAAARQKRLAQA